MGIGVSIFLIAVGAILAFAVTTEVSGLDISTVGWRRETYVRDDPYNRPPPY